MAIVSAALLLMIQGSQEPAIKVARPTILIAELQTTKPTNPNTMSAMAEEIDGIGQLKSITYEIEDPVFREALYQGKVFKPEKYTLQDIQKSAKALGCSFFLIVSSDTVELKGNKKSGLRFSATLFKANKQVWTEAEVMDIVGKGQSSFEIARAAASSLAFKMSEGPFKELPKSRKEEEVPIGKGQSPIIPETTEDDDSLNDFAAIQEQVKTFSKNGKIRAAEMLLRDAIDAAPKDAVRRKALIEFLRQMGKFEAAIEATVSAGQALGDPTLGAIAARILLDAGKTKEASSMINEILAGQPTSVEGRLLSAEIQLRASDPEKALPHIEYALKMSPSSEAYALRAVCRALLGSEDGVKLDTEKLKKESSEQYAGLYGRILSILDDSLENEQKVIEEMIQKAVLKKNMDEVAETLDGQERLGQSCLALLGDNPANLRFQKSHGLRLLAFNLLIQSMTELKQYVTDRSTETLSDARIDFGEFVKTLKLAKTEFQSEIQGASISGTFR
jgi:tetratricopeptide (TPR) repeat protein